MTERDDGRPSPENREAPAEAEPIAEEETGAERPAARVDERRGEESRREDQERAREARTRASHAASSDDPRLGDWSGAELRAGQIALAEAQQRECTAQTNAFFEEVKDSKPALDKGYKVAGAYDVRIQGWTTRSKIIEVDGKRFFVLCSFPAGNTRRRFDRLMEAVSGDPMRKPTPAGWKRTVESRSEIPTVAGTRSDMVVMPYLEVFNAYDLFADQKDIQDFGPFDWAKQATTGDKLALIGPIGAALARLHASGKTWGEAILPNVVLDQQRQPTFVDPETTYEGIPEREQRARDVRTLIGSIAGALARAEDRRDFQDVAHLVLQGYGDDSELVTALDRLCAEPLGFRQKLTFEFWGKFRVGATDGKEFEEVRLSIRAAIAERRAG